MEYKINNLPKSEIEIWAAIPFADFEPHLKKAASFLSEENEIEGFRRGKAPYDIVKNRLGELTIYERAAELMIRRNYTELLEKAASETQQKELIPIGKPEITITKLAPGNDLEFKIKMALLPEVELPDYKSIAPKVLKQKKEISVSEEEIKKTLAWICESRAPLIMVDRPAQNGDLVEIDFVVRQEGVKIEGTESKNHPLTIGQGNFLPGFEDQLLGMKSGEEKIFTVTAPDDWHDKTLAGKAVEFKVTVKLVQEKKIPELNDDFVKSLGNFSSIDALKNNIREGLTQEKTAQEKQRIRTLLLEEISSFIKIEIPEILISAELAKMLQELKAGVENMQMNWTDYLLHINPARSQTPQASADATESHRTSNGVKKAEENLKKEWRGEAEKRVRAALILRAIAREEKVEPTEEEVKTAADRYLAQFENVEKAGPVRSRTSKTSTDAQAHRISNGIDPEELKEYTKGVLKNEKVFEFLENMR